jgi:acetyl esterase/lipase
MYLPKVVTFRGWGFSGTLMLALPLASLCSKTSNAQTPTVNDLAYATVTNDDGSPATLRLDLWPSTTGSAPAPLLIWIHGGAWLGGSYNSPPPALQPLLQSGFAVASVQYRLSGAAIFPAQIHDVKGAVRFLRAHSSEYNLDPTRFAAWGSSSGGHLTALLATSGDVAEAEGTTGGNLAYSSRIQAAVDYFGPTDLLQMNLDVTTPPGSFIDHDAPDSPESHLIGFDGAGEGIGVLRNNLSNPNPPFPEKAALVRLVNPIEHVTSDDPPVFIAHGNQDTLVPMNQSVRLATALDAIDIDHVMRVVVGAGHGFEAQDATVNAEAIAFLTAQLARIPGDFNGNGTVGPEDYELWKANFGSTTFPDADGNRNGIVDAADYTVWRDHLGAMTGSGAGNVQSGMAGAPIPEATSLALAIVAATLLCAANVHRVSAANRC